MRDNLRFSLRARRGQELLTDCIARSLRAGAALFPLEDGINLKDYGRQRPAVLIKVW
jgi:hypothetical protein